MFETKANQWFAGLLCIMIKDVIWVFFVVVVLLCFVLFCFFNSMLTTMFKDCYWQTNAMLKMREEYGKIKEPGLVLRNVFPSKN